MDTERGGRNDEYEKSFRQEKANESKRGQQREINRQKVGGKLADATCAGRMEMRNGLKSSRSKTSDAKRRAGRTDEGREQPCRRGLMRGANYRPASYRTQGYKVC